MGMFGRQPQVQPQPQPRPIGQSSGCKVKVRRDSSGRISSIESNGKCSKQELEIFRDNLQSEEESEEE